MTATNSGARFSLLRGSLAGARACCCELGPDGIGEGVAGVALHDVEAPRLGVHVIGRPDGAVDQLLNQSAWDRIIAKRADRATLADRLNDIHHTPPSSRTGPQRAKP